MKSHDLDAFKDGLLAAFDAIGAKPPGAKGIELWFRALRPHQLADVLSALETWLLRNRRAPTPSDLTDAIREIEIGRREVQAEQWRTEEHNGPYTMGRTETGRRALVEIKALVANMQRPRSGRQLEWAHRVIDRYVDHDPVLASIAFDFACDALGKTAEERAQLRAVREANVAGAARAIEERKATAAAEGRRRAAVDAERDRRAA